MRIAPMTEEYGQDIHNVLQQDPDNFPYEYYSVRFSTFSGGHFASFRRYLRHLLLDSARIDNEHAAQEYTRTVYSVNVPVADRYRRKQLPATENALLHPASVSHKRHAGNVSVWRAFRC